MPSARNCWPSGKPLTSADGHGRTERQGGRRPLLTSHFGELLCLTKRACSSSFCAACEKSIYLWSFELRDSTAWPLLAAQRILAVMESACGSFYFDSSSPTFSLSFFSPSWGPCSPRGAGKRGEARRSRSGSSQCSPAGAGVRRLGPRLQPADLVKAM
jgi:hypothetical protein